jgi:hypothetical protein
MLNTLHQVVPQLETGSRSAWDSGRMTGNPECAGLNRHVVGDARALQERK